MSLSSLARSPQFGLLLGGGLIKPAFLAVGENKLDGAHAAHKARGEVVPRLKLRLSLGSHLNHPAVVGALLGLHEHLHESSGFPLAPGGGWAIADLAEVGMIQREGEQPHKGIDQPVKLQQDARPRFTDE